MNSKSNPPTQPGSVERLQELLATIQENGTRLPWKLWTSCSFRRIKTDYRPDDRIEGKDVLSGIRCHDGVIDLSMPENQLDALVEAVNALPDLLTLIKQLQDELIEARRVLKPFADVCEAIDYWDAEAMPSFAYPVDGIETALANEDCPGSVGSLTERDFRAARTFIDKSQ